MSGTYQLSQFNSATMELWPKNPLVKRWSAQRVATGGTRQPIFSAVWQFEANFGTLEVQGEQDFFEGRYISGGLYNAILPHPITGQLVGFTGTSIEEVSFEFSDVNRDFYAEGSRVVLRVNLFATGTF